MTYEPPLDIARINRIIEENAALKEALARIADGQVKEIPGGSPYSDCRQFARYTLAWINEPKSLLRPAVTISHTPTSEQIRRGAEIMRSLKEPKT